MLSGSAEDERDTGKGLNCKIVKGRVERDVSVTRFREARNIDPNFQPHAGVDCLCKAEAPP